jgi:hypothetical protein
MKEIESIASALFDKVRSRFSNVTLGDENAKAETDPEKARFFNFTYTSEDGTEFGTVTISLINETGLKVYYGQNISQDMEREQRKEWYEFLRSMRKFAKRNLLTFDTRDINKSNLELKDLKQQSKADDIYTAGEIKVNESRLFGTPGRPYNSFGEKGKTKLLIRHQDRINDEIKGARARHIKEIFLETDRGERFLLDHTNLHGAWAMAEHLNQGGSMQDEFAEHINGMVAEMSSMRHFVRSTKHRQFEDKETAEMTEAAVQHYNQLKETLRRLRSSRYFKEYKSSYKQEESAEANIDVNALRERFVKKIYDDRFNDALPIVYRAYKKQKAIGDRFAEAFETWATDIAEGVYKTINTDKEINRLEELMSTSLRVGIDGIDATSAVGELIGDDDLDEAIYELSQSQGPDADARPLVKTWLQSNMPELLNQINIGEKNVDDTVTDIAPTTSPRNNQTTYGDNTMDAPVTEDSLDFIRNLAGIKR